MRRISDNLIISNKVKIADGFIDRLIGLMFKEPLKEHDSLLIKPCNSIHTFFMTYSLDIVFLSRDMTVLAIYKSLKPWRMTRMIFKAAQVLEMEAGKLSPELRVGDKLEHV